MINNIVSISDSDMVRCCASCFDMVSLRNCSKSMLF